MGNFYVAIQAVIVPCRGTPKTALIKLALVLVTTEPLWCRDQPLILYSHRQTIKVKSKTCTVATSTFADLRIVALKTPTHVALACFNYSVGTTLICLGKPGFYRRTEK